MSSRVLPEVHAAILAHAAIGLIDKSQDPKSGALAAREMLLRIAELLPTVPNANRTTLTVPPAPDTVARPAGQPERESFVPQKRSVPE